MPPVRREALRGRPPRRACRGAGGGDPRRGASPALRRGGRKAPARGAEDQPPGNRWPRSRAGTKPRRAAPFPRRAQGENGKLRDSADGELRGSDGPDAVWTRELSGVDPNFICIPCSASVSVNYCKRFPGSARPRNRILGAAQRAPRASPAGGQAAQGAQIQLIEMNFWINCAEMHTKTANREPMRQCRYGPAVSPPPYPAPAICIPFPAQTRPGGRLGASADRGEKATGTPCCAGLSPSHHSWEGTPTGPGRLPSAPENLRRRGFRALRRGKIRRALTKIFLRAESR
jgi:hypothetical protein